MWIRGIRDESDNSMGNHVDLDQRGSDCVNRSYRKDCRPVGATDTGNGQSVRR